jgi:hypothetical protein
MEVANNPQKRNMFNVNTLDETHKGSSPVDGTPSPRVFLFLRRAFVDNKNFIHFPQFYWSDDPTGLDPQAKMRYSHLDTPVVTAMARYTSWKFHHYDVLRQLHTVCGFDPESDAVARYLGIPDFELANHGEP